MAKKIKVGITHGDFNGVGYEVILKALADEAMTELCTPVIYGSPRAASEWTSALSLEGPRLNKALSAAEAPDGRVSIIDVCGEIGHIAPGVATPESGAAAVKALDAAMDALKAGEIDVLVTAPICKENVQSDSFRFPGHTEYLQAASGDGASAMMILFDDILRVALVTTHLPIAKVPAAISRQNVADTVKRLDATLRRDFGIERPRIAVLALNPHAGDNGLLGDEEKERIAPAIEDASEAGVLAFGPFPADGFFGSGSFRAYDAVVAMYHDQGLAPFKALAGASGVNFTAGLPFVRTSPDHGTAFNIAGKGVADESSMRQAIYAAIDIFRRRAVFDRASANPLRRHFVERGADKTVDLSADEPVDR